LPSGKTAKQFRLSQRIERIEVSGTSRIVAEAAVLRAQGVDLADLGAGEPHFSTPQHIAEAGIAAIREGFTRYTAGPGIPELRAAIAERHHRDFGTRYAAENVLVTPGGKFALFQALESILDPGDEVIVSVPYWVSFKDIVQFAGGKCIFVESDESAGFEVDPERIARALTARTRAIILNSPSNPSGAVADADTVRKIVELAAAHDIIVIADECYAYLIYSGERISAAAFDDQHVIVIGSLSKTYAMTGWRLGYALAPLPIMQAMQKLQSQTVTSVAAPVQKAALIAVSGSQECIVQMCREYRENRDLLWQALNQIRGIYCNLPNGAFYLYANVAEQLRRTGWTSTELTSKLLHEAHVVCVPGEAFGTEEHLRFSYAADKKRLTVAAERLQSFLSSEIPQNSR
jgi:aspartate aminotransferase